MYLKSLPFKFVALLFPLFVCNSCGSQDASKSKIPSIDDLASRSVALDQVIAENLGTYTGTYSERFSSESQEPLNSQDIGVFQESRTRNENWLFSPDKTLAISLNASITEPDQSVDIYNRQGNQHLERIDDCGASCKYIGIYWLDNSNFVSVAVPEYYPASNISQDSYVMRVSHYNLAENTIIRYQSSSISRPVQSDLPSNRTPEFSERQFQQVVSAYIAANEGEDSGYEREETRKIIYGDIDFDGDKDAVVEYTLIGAGGGNSYGQNLAVFRNANGQFEILADEVVGGKFYRTFNLKNITNGRIHGVVETCADTSQGSCQNLKVDQVTFVVQGNKLKEE